MSTRFYFRPTRTTPVAVTADAMWEWGAGTMGKGLLTPDPLGIGAPPVISNSTTTGGSPQDMVIAQFVSDPLPAVSLTGTFSLVMPIGENDVGDDAYLQVVIRVVSNNGTVVRGTAYAGNPGLGTTPQAWNETYEAPLVSSNLKTRYYNTFSMATVAVQAGDRIVVEVGLRVTGSAGTAGGSIAVHDREEADDYPLISDRAVNFPNPMRPWIEFSADLFPTLTREQFRFMYTGVLLNTDAALPFVDITKITGLDNAPVSLSQNAREGMHGGFVSSSFQSQRSVILEGDIYASPTALETYLDSLKANFKPTKRPHPLFFGTDSNARMVYGKSQGLKYDKDSFRRLGRVPFQVTIVCSDPRIYAAYGPKTAGAGTLVVGGNRETYPKLLYIGQITNPSFAFSNAYGDTGVAYTGVLTSTDYLVFDTDARTALLNNLTSVRGSLTITNDWPVLVPGTNIITVGGSSGGGQPSGGLIYQEAYE